MNDRNWQPAVSLCARSALLALFVAAPANASTEFELIPDIPTVVILVILFTLLIAPLNALVFRPIFKVLDERQDRIAGDRKRAQTVADEAERALAEYQAAVRAVREESESDRREQHAAARAEQGSITARARAEAEREIESHRDELGRSLDAARETLRGGAEAIALEIAGRVLGRNV